MGRLRTSVQRATFEFLARCTVTGVLLLIFSCSTALTQGSPATLHGTVRDPEGKPVPDALVTLQPNGETIAFTARSDEKGNYYFGPLRDGVYVLRVNQEGYAEASLASLFVGPEEQKSVDLTLVPTANSSSKPQFFDEPRFTVSGVTDTTSLGGHGSDTVVRTRETLAKETASLARHTDSERPEPSAYEENLRQKIAHDPRDFESNARLGKLLVETGRAREALPVLERASKLNPNGYANTYELAVANASAGNNERARILLQSLLPAHDTAEGHHLLGDVEEKLGNSLDAVRHFQRAAELSPTEPYLFDWGSELLLHHAPEPAIEVFTKGNHSFPRSARMLLGLGAAWFAHGSYDTAVQRVGAASDLNPDDPTPYVFLGKMMRAESSPSAELVEKLQRFVKLHPENAEANYYLALSLWKRRGNSEDAASIAQIETLLTKAVQLDENFADANLQLGILHFDRRDLPSAVADFQQAIHASPKMEEAHYRLSQAYRQAGDNERAQVELRLYDKLAKESAQRADRERREIRQFVYTLRDQPAGHSH